MLQANRVSQITVLSEPALSAIPGIVHGFSTRRAEHNAFTLGPSSENPADQMNRARFLAAVGMPGWPMLKLKQMHSNIVHDMRDTWAASQPVEGDAAITALRRRRLGIQTADCVPILIADKNARVIAAVHAGWRGIAQRIAETRGEEDFRLTVSAGRSDRGHWTAQRRVLLRGRRGSCGRRQ